MLVNPFCLQPAKRNGRVLPFVVLELGWITMQEAINLSFHKGEP